MKRFAALSMIALSLSLASCADRVSDLPSVSEISARIEIESVRALNVTEILYQAAARTALEGIRLGMIKGHDAENVRILNERATAKLVEAKSALTVDARVAATTALSEETAGLRSYAIMVVPELAR